MNVYKRLEGGPRLILLGAPGAGKGTQAKMLSDRLGVPHVASGDLFRYHQSQGTSLGNRAKEYMAKGLLVPDEITIEMVLDRILMPEFGGFLLDGFPRTVPQATALDEALNDYNQSIDHVVLIKVPVKELTSRLGGRFVCSGCQSLYHITTVPPNIYGICDQCGGKLYQRRDDTEEAVKVRLNVYRDETEPLVDMFQVQGKLTEIDGLGAINDIGERLMNVLERYLTV